MQLSDPDYPDVVALQGGEDEALDRLMQKHRPAITAFIFRMVGDADDADELAQETFVRAYFQIGTYRPRALFAAWLHQIARNLCRDHFRSRAYKIRMKSQSMETLTHERLSGEERGSQSVVEQVEMVQAALLRIPVALRECLILTAIEGLSHEEAAAYLGLTSKAVEVRCYRARKALLKVLSLQQKTSRVG